MKPLCDLKDCPSVGDKAIELKPLIDQFVNEAYRDNPKANPLCIKRIVSELLSKESARLFVEFVESKK
jgi:hypothetical protein|tara:strand:+ start:185 stop:388 length:204 start_codon:yes stop_codon:yes gene_type:complete